MRIPDFSDLWPRRPFRSLPEAIWQGVVPLVLIALMVLWVWPVVDAVGSAVVVLATFKPVLP